MTDISSKEVRAKPVILCIMDGWGYSESQQHNAVYRANTPNWDALWKDYPHSLLGTSGLDVGLPDGQMGNSEVGHMNIGSGRVVMQDLPRIDAAIADGSLAGNPHLQELISKLKENGKKCHLMGLLSDGGVHAHIDHIIALAKIVAEENITVCIHAFTDGRDTPPGTAKNFIDYLEEALQPFENANISTVSGRYYAMDRDNRWERVSLAYDAMVLAKVPVKPSAHEALRHSYDDNKTDEFILPAIIENYNGMEDGDGLLMANFRSDRARQILDSLANPNFDGCNREKVVEFSSCLGMVEYSESHNAFMKSIFSAQKLNNTIGEIVSASGLKQLRISETEKYAHVTFFFNGGEEKEFPGEERILVPSPSVATYDLKPEMSAAEVTAEIVNAIDKNTFDLIIVNYANTDMVGHTGVEEAAIKAVEAVDEALGQLHNAVKNQNGALLITADHGNAELMVAPETNQPHTQHTLNPVPFVVCSSEDIAVKDGRLCDIAPTILSLMKLPQPKEMTGTNLVSKKNT